MKLAVPAVLALWTVLAAQAALAEECDKLVAARLNGEAQEELQRLDVSPNVTETDQGHIEELKQRFQAASDLHTAALDRHNDEDLKTACDAYRSIYDEAKAIAE